MSPLKNKRPVPSGFMLLEVMISLAIVGSLLVTLIYTLNHHLGAAQRQETVTVALTLAKEKIYEMEKRPVAGQGGFNPPFAGYSYVTEVRKSSLPGMTEIGVSVRSGTEAVSLGELIRTGAYAE